MAEDDQQGQEGTRLHSGTQLAVLYTVEPLYIEDTTGASWLSCIQWNLSIVDTIGTQLAGLYREVSLIQR